jgi:acetyl-CoA carboxylase carboxyl transferase subunit alpha
LWKDAARSGEAAEALKITSWDLKQLGLLDVLLTEPVGGAHAHPIEAADSLKQALIQQLADLSQLTPTARQQLRYQKYRQIGVFAEAA